MMNNVKNRKAITLIALVITIVVLIILAAVAINLSLGNNGIFNRAKTAKEQYQNAEIEEKRISSESIEYISGERTLSTEQVEEKINDFEYRIKELELQNTVLQLSNTDNIEIVTGSLAFSFSKAEWKYQNVNLSGHGKGIAIITAYADAATTATTDWGINVDGICDYSKGNSTTYRCSSATAFKKYDEDETIRFGLYSSAACSNKNMYYRIMYIPQSGE